MKQKTTYQKPEIQQVMALTAGGFAQSPSITITRMDYAGDNGTSWE